jgi:hypothetical protein
VAKKIAALLSWAWEDSLSSLWRELPCREKTPCDFIHEQVGDIGKRDFKPGSEADKENDHQNVYGMELDAVD